MQVRGHAVRGLDLHLRRLRDASSEMFDRALPDERIVDVLHRAVHEGPPDASVACYVASRPGEFLPAGPDVALDVLVKVGAPADPPAGPLALDVVRHERHLAHLKHVGEVAKTQYLRRARARGLDDTAFEDADGRLLEATIWNLAFWDGETVVWPEGDVLPGVTMQILARRLADAGVPQQTRPVRRTDLHDGMSAVVMNSWSPGIPVSGLGGRALALDPALVGVLHDAYAAEPPVPL